MDETIDHLSLDQLISIMHGEELPELKKVHLEKCAYCEERLRTLQETFPEEIIKVKFVKGRIF